MTPLDRIKPILRLLKKKYSKVRTALVHANPLELLIATILSAQTTDKQVGKVTPALFKKYAGAEDFANATLSEFQKDIQSIGLYRNKAKAILACCQMILEKFGGKVPDRMEDLVQLPGVGRKTANVVLGNVFDKNEGVCVDTHVARLSQRIGLSKHKDPIKIEKDLMSIVPQNEWTDISHVLILHGRETCGARNPKCLQCELREYCSYGKMVGARFPACRLPSNRPHPVPMRKLSKS